MKNKLLVGLICILLIVCLSITLASCNKKPQETKAGTILFLGDSIAEGIAGSAPLQEKVNYSYYGILAQINDIKVDNRSVSGYQTRDLLNYLYRGVPDEELPVGIPVAGLYDPPIVDVENANITQSLLKTADIIHTSILGNDMLQYDFGIMLLEIAAQKEFGTTTPAQFQAYCENNPTNHVVQVVKAEYALPKYTINSDGTGYFIPEGLSDDYDEPMPGYGLALFDYQTKNATANMEKIIARMRELNPTAKLIFQNVYNPVDLHSELVSNHMWENFGAINEKYNIAGKEGDALYAAVKELRKISGELVWGFDSILNKYNDTHDDKIYIADAFHGFDEIYNDDVDLGEALIYVDGVHPSDVGHAVLAQITQKLLVDNKLVDSAKGVEGYKKLRISQLNRMYKGTKNSSNRTFDFDEISSRINVQTDLFSITKEYFGSIYGEKYNTQTGFIPKLFSDVKQGRTNGVALSANTKYKLDTLYFYNYLAGNIRDIVSMLNIATLADGIGLDASIEFKTDNTFLLSFKLNVQEVLANIQTVIDSLPFSINIDIEEALNSLDEAYLGGSIMGGNPDLIDLVHYYALEMFPGFDISDFAGSIHLLRESLGLYITGLDDWTETDIATYGEDKCYLNYLINYLINQPSQQRYTPTGLSNKVKTLGDLSINIEGCYSVVDVQASDGKTYKGLYLGNYYENISPYMICTQYTDEEGIEHIRMQSEILGLFLQFAKPTAA